MRVSGGERLPCMCARLQCDMCEDFEEDGDYSEGGLDEAQTEDGDSAKAGVKALGYQKKNAR